MAIDRDRILAAAQKYLDKKRYDRAAVEYQKILQEDPNDARILLKLGDLQSKMEAYADSVATYDRVGKFYASQGFALKAIAVFKQIREIIARYVPELDERYGHIVPQLAELYQQLGLTSDALAALDEVATRLQRQGRDQDAVSIFRKIVELDPSGPLSHLRLAEALLRVKDVEAAVAEFAVASDQLVKLGRRDDALKVIERLLGHRQDAALARSAAELYLGRGGTSDGMQALAKLQIAFQANPRDLATLALLARAFNHLGQAAKAVEVQKEMARIARDSGKSELFAELVAKLLKLAPNDEGVLDLASNKAEPAPPKSQTSHREAERESEKGARSEQELDLEESYEDVGDGDIESEESPGDGVPGGSGLEPGGQPAGRADDVFFANRARDDGRSHVSRALSDAAAHRRGRQHTMAIATLRSAIQRAPRAVELHEMLRDVLQDVGSTREAIAEMIAIAELLVESLDGESAARSLQDALSLDPDNATAARMLHDLGYELVEEQASSMDPFADDDASFGEGVAGYAPERPLPAYDLEDAGSAEMPGTDIDSIDDPFADSPLPSFPLDGPGEGGNFAMSRSGTVERSPNEELPAGPRPIPELEAALEEADFFASRELLDDARTILEEQLVRLPNHPLLLDRLAELDAQERSLVGGSGTRPSPAASAASSREFDIAASLSALEVPPTPSSSRSLGGPTEQVDVEEVFAKFKAGVAQQIGVDDAQSHYDLGVAYKEMALLDDAVREFEMAAREAKRACICHSMIGMIHLERGRLNDAIEAFLRGLSAPDRTRDQEAALNYEIGSAYEAKKLAKQALDHFQHTARLVPSFRDVQERLRRLQRPDSKQPSRAVAVGADDEFDRAFDDILGEGKRP